MSTTSVTELVSIPPSHDRTTTTTARLPSPSPVTSRRESRSTAGSEDGPQANIATTIPEGGYGWFVVASCSILTFWFNGTLGSWGVLQAALLRSDLATTPTSTVSFVGSLGLANIVAFGLFGVRLMRILGARLTSILGVALLATGAFTSSFTTSNVGGLFGCSGVLFGFGASLCYSVSNVLPTHYFSARLGLASGLVKFGGGVGAAVLSIAIEALIRHVGIPWTFRIIGLLALATGLPAAWFIRERVPIGHAPFLDLSMFRNLAFTSVFLAGAIGVFCMFVPPFFLPLVAESLGMTPSTGAAIVAGFNACTAVGRFVSGWLSDYTGPVNMLLLSMLVNAITCFAIWPVSESLAPLLTFAMLNGLANGAFFTIYPVVVASTSVNIGYGHSSGQAVAMGMATTGWTGGYLLGVPIAGYLLQASGVGAPGQSPIHTSVAPYRPAIFYAAAMALAAAGFVMVARIRLSRGGKRKV
ncbi:hypothetical protein PV10_08604 [Exophiala mesophila]|uniref:Major facilitator superfamily (MFS) profile domain-containing protein n=1 Tax=Exophiala mesophila TaxID=212818 RepID=A0A0D1WJC2_EXOME|nr:uncharacterized protein PV10_08604 [Exophiala mesophila]KIV88980.1 hypothetical protein PV10_08604 [Exophiala mesophila]